MLRIFKPWVWLWPMLQPITHIGPRWRVSPNCVHERVWYVAYLVH